MPDWVWYTLAGAALVAVFAFLGSMVGGMFGPDRPDRPDSHAMSGRGQIVRRMALILLALLGLYAIVDYVVL